MRTRQSASLVSIRRDGSTGVVVAIIAVFGWASSPDMAHAQATSSLPETAILADIEQCPSKASCIGTTGICTDCNPSCENCPVYAQPRIDQGVKKCAGSQACCLPGGGCIVTDGLCCDEAGGVAAGPGTASECAVFPNICSNPVPRGACCSQVDSSCVDDVTEFTCLLEQGATWHENVDCADLDPPCVPSACCYPFPFQACAELSYVDCLQSGGDPQPLGVFCADINIDSDGDEILDACDNCPDDANIKQLDDDGDGIGNQCDNCSPHDVTNHCGDPGIDCTNPDQTDCDHDNVGDICDNCRNCANEAQADSDLDGVGDFCDNCPDNDNPNQHDCDGDGLGDVCDPDIDDDNVPNELDVCDYTTSSLGFFVFPAGHPLAGTVIADVDGDCDVDQQDLNIVQAYQDGAGCADGVRTIDACHFPQVPLAGPESEPTDFCTTFQHPDCD